MKNSALVSIVINNYNYGSFLGQAIESALTQTYPSVEVIVVDDGSTDNSREVIAGYGEQIVPVLKENGGQASAFNAGFVASQGDLVCLLDADDFFLPEKVAAIVDIFKHHPDSGWCFHPLKMVDAKGEILFEALSRNRSQAYDFRSHIQERGKLSFSAPATSGLCFRRSLLQQILPMPEGRYVSIGDHYLKFTALALSKGFFLDENLTCQRVHSKNAYTLKANNQRLKARILVLAAYWIKSKFPTLSRFTNNLFARGMSTYWRTGGIEREHTDIISHYFSSASWPEKLEINSRAIYRYLVPERS
ncbi:MAG: glycosyltransferase [Cyanothece sp. SIO1E1]|nr:glycosyltransferase [Cyanothece sp. SIO1E1]